MGLSWGCYHGIIRAWKDVKQHISLFVCLWFPSFQLCSPHTFKICPTTEHKSWFA